MPQVPGRTFEARSATVSRTSASTAVTGAAGTFQAGDVGRTISGTGIPAGATLTAVASATTATLSAAATTTTNGAVTLGQGSEQTYGFFGWSPATDAEAASYTVSAVNAGTVPADRISGPTQGRLDHQRSR